jgi:hypothetical protein
VGPNENYIASVFCSLPPLQANKIETMLKNDLKKTRLRNKNNLSKYLYQKNKIKNKIIFFL